VANVLRSECLVFITEAISRCVVSGAVIDPMCSSVVVLVSAKTATKRVPCLLQ